MDKIKQIKDSISTVIVGKEDVTTLILAAFFAKGHVLLEDLPGTGKTMMVRALAQSLGLDQSRIQFTPDLLPADVTGISFFNQKTSEFTFRPGPVFTNILLADEINRATPRTQSSLLECMGENRVTTDGVTRELDNPFFVIATQNPVETLGCFPLPQAQLDRFMLKLSMGNLTQQQEEAMVDMYIEDTPIEKVQPVITKEEILALQEKVSHIYVHKQLRQYIVSLLQATRNGSMQGVGPRGTLALLKMSQSYAMVNGRDYVVPEDIKTVAPYVLAHRYMDNLGSDQEKLSKIKQVLAQVDVPTENWERL